MWSPPVVSRKSFSLTALDPETASRAPCAASACAIADPIPPEAPVTRAVMPVRSNMEISPGIVCSERFKQRLDVVHRQDTGRRDLPRRAALYHGAQPLAAEFDDLVHHAPLQPPKPP